MLRALAIALAITIPTTASNAAVIYSSVSNLQTASTSGGYCSPCNANGYNVGQQFTLNSTTVRSIAFVLGEFGDYHISPVTLSLYKDASGRLGDLVFRQTFSYDDFASVSGESYRRYIAVNVPDIALTGTYDLFLSSTQNLSVNYYHNQGNGLSIFSRDAQATSSYSYNTYDYSNRNDIGLVLFDTPAIPEPATWAMMIAGFALVGAAMRRRLVRELGMAA